jgi:putative solute:sodium symporter small subunit
MNNHNLKEYWAINIRYVLFLISIWFVVSYGFGILLAPTLNDIQIGGFKLGFWFAQQGSIYVFVILIFVYVYLMNKLDIRFGVQETEEKS